ncbi:class I SAM-dependent methyltransferase [Flavobacteriaceae bacterium TP-CH-4]|uniref:Class I SAM-dependent methyltransferase n=1 Tax=Pelagihabitans pacificus TaxID=2696054 RepID=A0A967ED80_9FLAO|nr:class I SAM-dependent methyltransferase [Pelagihabitans pacificus]NHF59058.1 class I SAM-dependent methyltransferase [Pelagihabitans pacificus]
MKSYLRTKDHAVSGEEFELLLHEDLEMLITKPRPKDLDRYYESTGYISHTDANSSLLEKIYQTVKRYSIRRKVRLINRYDSGQRTLMDFGAGTGDFLLAAKRKGWEVSGVEPNWGARKKASEKGINLIPEIAPKNQRKYQVITLWHVLEHLPDLENQISKLVDLLEDEGTLIVAVPNFKSFDAEHYKEFWAAYDVPRHLWHFSRSAIQKLFASSNLKVINVKPMHFDSFYVALLSEKYKTGKQRYLHAFFNGLRSNIMAWRSKEYSSLIYILQRGQNS